MAYTETSLVPRPLPRLHFYIYIMTSLGGMSTHDVGIKWPVDGGVWVRDYTGTVFSLESSEGCTGQGTVWCLWPQGGLLKKNGSLPFKSSPERHCTERGAHTGSVRPWSLAVPPACQLCPSFLPPRLPHLTKFHQYSILAEQAA